MELRIVNQLHWAVAVALALPLGACVSPGHLSPAPVLAETTLGPVTVADINGLLERNPRIRLRDPNTEAGRAQMQDLTRTCALEEILLHLAAERDLVNEPRMRAELDRAEEERMMFYAVDRLVREPSLPSREELLAVAEERSDEFRLPPLASWRFMHFEDDDAGWDRAREARRALAQGETFADVASRMAVTPITTEPGELIGPTTYEGRFHPEVVSAIETLPLGEVSDPIDTPVGPVLLTVEARHLDRRRPEERILVLLEREIHPDRFRTHAQEVRAALVEKYPAEMPEDLTADMDAETPALRVGNRVLTIGHLRRRAMLEPEPDIALEAVLSVQGRDALVADQRLLCEFAAVGGLDDPQLLRELAAERRHLIIQRTLDRLGEEKRPAPPEHVLRAHWEAHPGAFERELLSVETLRILISTMRGHVGSDQGLDIYRGAEALRARWRMGEPAEALLGEIGGDLARPGEGVTRWTDSRPGEIPFPVRRSVTNLERGEISEVQVNRTDLVLARLVDRRTALIEFEDITPEVTRHWRRSQPPMLSLQAELLEECSYRPAEEAPLLERSDDGSLSLSNRSTN